MSSLIEPTHVGSRVAHARRNIGLSQKLFAERVGIPLWALDRIETGAGDAAKHLSKIAALTGRPEGWFARSPTDAAVAASPPRVRARLVPNLRWHPTVGRDLVLCAIGLLVVVRFFTEVAHVIPRAANFVDIPIFLSLSAAALARPRTRTPGPTFAVPALLFVFLCAISVTVNLARVEPGPVLVFVYGFLAPIGVCAAAFRLWPVGQALVLSRLLVGLGVLQLFVVAVIDLPRFIASGNPDVVSGTFGTNAYQMVFFLLLFTALLAGIFAFEKHRLAARLALPLFGGCLTAIFLAQYRALLVTTALTVIFIGLLLGARGRGIVAATIVVASFAVSLSYVAQRFPVLKFAPTISVLHQDPSFYVSKRVEAARTIINLYNDRPSFILTGTGPGTFSSRAWQTFSGATSKSKSNVQGAYVNTLTGGRVYHTDVSDKYVAPLAERPAIGGSRALTSPFSSYVSLLAEVGVAGFLLLVGVYVAATGRVIKMAFRTVQRAGPGDSLPGLVLACAVGFFVLLQMGFLENWLEVTRITFPVWMLLGVTSKELSARAGAM